MATTHFYTHLPVHAGPFPQLLVTENFTSLPPDWHVVIADIQNSSVAVQAGAHNDVNLVAAGSLVAGLNVAREKGIEVPFFFGGDGGTLLVPEAILNDVLAALQVHNRNSQQNFGFNLHLGSVSVKDIEAAGHFTRLAKIRMGRKLAKAVVVGDGLLWAERQVKAAFRKPPEAFDDAALLNMDGLECRWDRIKPPNTQPEIVCYLIEACKPQEQIALYREVLLKADAIFGVPELRNPLSIDKLSLLGTVQKLRKEMLVRFGKLKRSYLITELLKTAIGKVVFRHGLKVADLDGKTYLEDVISNADTLTLDGRINTIISGTADQRLQFLAFLNQLEASGKLRYGHHIDGESVITCYIQSRDAKHIHFVDGSEGGYTAAAGELKGKVCPA